MTREFLTKAKENLHAAQLCFDNALYNACANRIYYAALHAAVAAMAQHGLQPEKIDHKQVQAEFNGKLIYRQKRYPAHFKSYLPDMQVLRNQADYSEDSISRKIAERWLGRAQEMITWIAQEVQA